MLTSSNTSTLYLPPTCTSPPPTSSSSSPLTFCPNLSPSLSLPSSLNPYPLDLLASTLYAADLSLYAPSITDCQLQAPNVSMCASCLAVRQRWRCAQAFGGWGGGCGGDGGGWVGSGVEGEGGVGGGPCQWLCREKNGRCGEVEDCSVYPTVNCNSARGGWQGTWMARWWLPALMMAVYAMT